MARIEITGGLERDEFYDRNNNLVGVAEYDLNDSSVRLHVLEFADSMEARWQKLMASVDSVLGDSSVKELTELEAELEGLEGIYAIDPSDANLSALEAVEKKISNINFKGGLEKTRLEVSFVDQLIADADGVFGVDFCAKAIGPNCRNYFTLMEVLLGIVEKYGARPNIQMDKLVNATKNREQKRLEKHGKGKRK